MKHRAVWAFTLLVALVALASVAGADVNVDFVNSTLPQGSLTNDLGVLTLSFSVDGGGNVTLDASTTQTIPATIDAVNAWDGNVGTISYTGAFGTVFALVVNDVGGSGLKLTDNGGGVLGVGGLNAWRIDNPGVESVTMDATVPGAALDFQTISWAHRANITVDMLVVAPSGSATNSLPSISGTWDVSADDLAVEDGEQLALENVDLGDVQDGYGLAGISFDVVPPAPPVADGIVTVAFPNDLLARRIDVPVRLDFAVDGTGNVTLDASTTSADAHAMAAVNGWDGYVGGLTNPAAFESTFYLQLEAAKQSGAAFVNLGEIDPGGIGVGGQNSSRVDGGGLVPPNMETLCIVASSGAARVEFVSVGWNNSVNGVEMTAAAGRGARHQLDQRRARDLGAGGHRHQLRGRHRGVPGPLHGVRQRLRPGRLHVQADHATPTSAAHQRSAQRGGDRGGRPGLFGHQLQSLPWTRSIDPSY